VAIDLGTDGYCEASDVQALHQQRTFSASTKPTTTQVENFITKGFHRINGVLDAIGYTIPVDVDTYTQSADILKEINVNYALFRVELAAYSAGVGGFPEGAKEYREEFNTALKDLQEGRMKLPDAPVATDFLAAQNEREPSGEFNLDDTGTERDPVFTRTSEW